VYWKATNYRTLKKFVVFFSSPVQIKQRKASKASKNRFSKSGVQLRQIKNRERREMKSASTLVALLYLLAIALSYADTWPAHLRWSLPDLNHAVELSQVLLC
jgi:hypothetical protein